ncbi:3-phosphoglycerate dehydrogenase [Thermaurantimonas aggregans]|uniref:3-phosphoglycerate dehydrogenase n=1 Tax=Thermaurantimonas aggregans TaxID=2173829 RepID=A0A401XKG8_9FLAO|nr:D-2-hydroxyacid dehydrogenase [Thermaurantimonas aggregans]MCX8147863.1 D-2-hydroxyacid dehydrogenase [Thermaurantimonas aggregans]GCD77526.1 3-phosphoglycerate dehydrogenase [Thermaurantimonas aggregans]
MKILANDGLNPAGIRMLEAAGFEVITNKVAQEALPKFINENKIEILLVRSATKVRKDLIDACPGLKLIGRGGVGMDNIDVEYARSKGIAVVNTPASSSDSVAELVMAHLYGMVRFLHDSNRLMPLEGETRFNELKKKYSDGRELRGKTLGIIGIGRIGQSLARLALGVGMKVIASDPYYTESVDIKLDFCDGQSVTIKVPIVDMDSLLAQSDFVSLHVPAADKPIIGREQIAKMKDKAAIVNAARGGIVDEEALLEALDSGKLAYAGLDVFKNEPTPAMRVLMHPAVSLTPHIGASTVEAQERIGEEMAQIIISHFKK